MSGRPFAKGASKPAGSGRRAGTPNRGTERARRLISEADDKAIVDQIVRDAKANNPHALQVYFRHLRPPTPKETYVGPVDYTAPKTIEEARALILELGERLARREIPLEAHDALLNGVKAYLSDVTAEQERRLSALEEALHGGGS